MESFLLTPLREGRPIATEAGDTEEQFLLTPLREGRLRRVNKCEALADFYSRPCGRGDCQRKDMDNARDTISTHAPAGGATRLRSPRRRFRIYFYSRPCGRGDHSRRSYCIVQHSISTHAPAGGATQLPHQNILEQDNFYSRPCGRGDGAGLALGRGGDISTHAPAGGATRAYEAPSTFSFISTHAPAGGATSYRCLLIHHNQFLLTPLREGRQAYPLCVRRRTHFYSRPCGRGDWSAWWRSDWFWTYFYSRPCGRGDAGRAL